MDTQDKGQVKSERVRKSMFSKSFVLATLVFSGLRCSGLNCSENHPVLSVAPMGLCAVQCKDQMLCTVISAVTFCYLYLGHILRHPSGGLNLATLFWAPRGFPSWSLYEHCLVRDFKGGKFLWRVLLDDPERAVLQGYLLRTCTMRRNAVTHSWIWSWGL